MKKIINILLLSAMTSLFVACDYNERNFPGMEEKEQVKNIVSYVHEVSTADITTIVNALRAKKNLEDSTTANKLNTAKAFSSELPPVELLPYLLSATYRAADVDSRIKVMFPYVNDYVTELSGAGSYVVSAADYETVWGTNTTAFFTPSNTPAAKLPAILNSVFSPADSGAIKVVRYDYSENEPAGSGSPKPNPQPYNAIYTYNGTAWMPHTNAVALNPADYDAMGVSNLTATTIHNYLPNFLAVKFPYAQEGAVKAVVYGSKTGNPGGNAAEYQYTAGAWTKIKKTEQYALSPQGWVFDPTIYYTMTKDDHKKMVDYMKETRPEFVVKNYENEEFYYGFSSRYTNLSFRLSYRVTYAEFDSELTEADSNEKKIAILFKRSEKGMLIFCEKKFTDAVQFKDGIQVQYKIKVIIHSPNDGLTREDATYEYAFKCIKSGTGESDPAEFEYIGKEQIPAL